MKLTHMARSGLTVSELAFGTLTLGPLQANLTPEEGARAIRRALELGINFFDTAQNYRNYAHIARGLAGWPDQVVIACKSHAASYTDMARAVEEALAALNRQHIDIFFLHLILSEQDFLERKEALRCLIDLRRQGLIEAIGASTHSAKGVRAVLDHEAIDVVFPVVNMRGLGIQDGTLEEMLAAVSAAKARGKDLYAMKPLGGGHLIADIPAAVDYLRKLGLFDSICMGMKTPDEVETNVRVFAGERLPDDLLERLRSAKKQLLIYDTCQRCGICEETCDQGAIHVGPIKAVVDPEMCILCGYCAAACPHFNIRVV